MRASPEEEREGRQSLLGKAGDEVASTYRDRPDGGDTWFLWGFFFKDPAQAMPLLRISGREGRNLRASPFLLCFVGEMRSFRFVF
jgi:hypothetical protein